MGADLRRASITRSVLLLGADIPVVWSTASPFVVEHVPTIAREASFKRGSRIGAMAACWCAPLLPHLSPNFTVACCSASLYDIDLQPLSTG